MKKLILAIILAIRIILLLVWGNHYIIGTKSRTPPVESPVDSTSAGSADSTNFTDTEHLLLDPDADDEDTGSDGKWIYLTFDDGPSSVSDKILDILDQYKVKATFFMLEPHMRTYPEILKRMVKEGHGVGIHGVTHDKHKFYHSEQTAFDEMIKGQATLESITGIKTELIRSPYGSIPYLLDSYRQVLDYLKANPLSFNC
ncbi:polysaccharide deacetylase family protein [Paenibacillus sp. GCM10012307]|uniref:Polysaccharide deacetylase family protein n=1 Tax=Paenibacillus roseus TaxID=2798579 RepID=A0A934J4C1_9BACL|nr:polysaccharide deacetylase family protein [Paenibacillus roseus]MBJ6360103.1 polysaccharide deacetylase family protein [Paenibacillus roseus]